MPKNKSKKEVFYKRIANLKIFLKMFGKIFKNEQKTKTKDPIDKNSCWNYIPKLIFTQEEGSG